MDRRNRIKVDALPDPDPIYSPNCPDELVWIRRRIDTTDPRFDAPVPRTKLMAPDPRSLPVPEYPWFKPSSYNPRTYHRNLDADTRRMYVTQVNGQSEEMSTLRQMLPSRGYHKAECSPNWGTAASRPPKQTDTPPTHYPQIRSPMTVFVGKAVATDPLFRMF